MPNQAVVHVLAVTSRPTTDPLARPCDRSIDETYVRARGHTCDRSIDETVGEGDTCCSRWPRQAHGSLETDSRQTPDRLKTGS
jgi:hypothetical protein